MYVHEYSGHHHAALALEKTFQALQPKTECRLVDALRYTHPILERLIRRSYLEIIKKKPEVWEYLYDNPWVLKNTQTLRQTIHRSHSRKFKRLLSDFKPDAIVCTQAFPCGVVSDYKVSFTYPTPLYGVLTDFLPHSYWVLDEVDRYFVPNQEAKEKLHENGVFEDQISVTGIPIDPDFMKFTPKDVSSRTPVVLVMGGGEGIGPMERIVSALDRLDEVFEMAVVTGKNEALCRKLKRRLKKLKKRVRLYGYLENTAGLMHEATLLISKPGGLTISEALACQLPVIFIDPIPGQEAKNASYLLRHRAALEAKTESEVALFAGQLLRTPAKMDAMKKNMSLLASPDASFQIAKTVLGEEIKA